MPRAGGCDPLTIDEVMALLKRTFLHTIVVEGSDDIIVYRRFEERLSHLGISVLPVGGRRKVLDIFRRRAEVRPGVKLLFIADRDTWIHTGVPDEFEEESLIFTNGYSIENDIYQDGELWRLLHGSEHERFGKELEGFIEWYALALTRHLADQAIEIGLHPDHVLGPTRASLLALESEERYPTPMKEHILENHRTLLRGKSLLALLLRNMNYRGRQPQHSSKGLMEIVATRPGDLLRRMIHRIETLITA